LGYFLEERLKPLAIKSRVPLAYFGIYKNPEELSINPEFSEKEFEILKNGFGNFKIGIEKEEYIKAIKKIKNYIAEGDVYQTNFTFKLHFEFKGSLERLFYLLLFSQRCKFGCFAKAGDQYILSLSPELFLEKRGKILKSSPMKGTIQRGFSRKEDLEFKRKLKNSLKNQAENIMIVDLLRNDFGKICEKGSVYVSELFKIETYPTLHQMISTIKGTLRDDSLYKIFKALFPCGSITGAPKIRAMEIIRELEKEPRGIYTGAIGFIKPDGNFLFNVAIRTLTLEKRDNIFIGEAGVGGGIVWDSIPEEEFREGLLKARFFLSPLPYFKLIETFYFDTQKENPLLLFHYKRIKNSALYFGFKIPYCLKSYEEFKRFVKNKAFGLKSGIYKIRLLISPDGGVEIIFSEYQPWRENLRVGLVKRDFDLGVLFHHKTSFRKPYEYWQNKAKKLGFDEIIFYNENGVLLEGCISNVFVDLGKGLITPPLELKILNGVLREFLISKKRQRKK